MDKKLVVSSKKHKGETSVVSLRLPVDLIARIDDICDQTGRTRNEIISMSIDFALENIVVEDK